MQSLIKTDLFDLIQTVMCELMKQSTSLFHVGIPEFYASSVSSFFLAITINKETSNLCDYKLTIFFLTKSRSLV